MKIEDTYIKERNVWDEKNICTPPHASFMHTENCIAVPWELYVTYVSVRASIFLWGRNFSVAAEPLVNLELSPLSRLCFTHAGRSRLFAIYQNCTHQRNTSDACFARRVVRLSAIWISGFRTDALVCPLRPRSPNNSSFFFLLAAFCELYRPGFGWTVKHRVGLLVLFLRLNNESELC